MSKFAILSAFVLLCAQLPGGLASPAMMKRQGHEQGPVDPPAAPTKPIEARQAVVTSVVGGVTSVVGGVTSVVGGVTSIIGGILADEPVATATAVLDRRDGVAISVGGDITFDGHFTVDTDAAASKIVEARQAVVTTVIGVLGDESTAIPAATASAVVDANAISVRQNADGAGPYSCDLDTGCSKVVEARQVDASASVSAAVPVATAELEARQGMVVSVGGGVAGANFGGLFTVQSSALPAAKTVTSVVGGVTSVVGGVTTVIGGVTSVLGKAVPTPPVQH
ncbi:uncharacterized protein EV420DRAFT_1745271 [Desarmillaria tabescens]|uniref:Uncharacterized protein n=1 Tax=Armillaria tabescens TaxID=1929756 RepID=A0AA39NDP8_ARMTA|nr:uncharacterized protein EV420DRAFT_1745271 [Desarmillaria tabescens]KAK0463758.1 hypothetical protein EV420DRAFT_1745271 [Desarmillaria tabescens]